MELQQNIKAGDLVRHVVPIKEHTKYDNPPLIVLYTEKLYPEWSKNEEVDTCIYVLDTVSDEKQYYYDWELELINQL